MATAKRKLAIFDLFDVRQDSLIRKQMTTCGYLKRRIIQIISRVNLPSLKSAPTKVWGENPATFIDELIGGMPRRVKNLIPVAF